MNYKQEEKCRNGATEQAHIVPVWGCVHAQHLQKLSVLSSPHSSPVKTTALLFFQSGTLAASQILANWEQQDPHLKDHTPCPLYCCFSRLSAACSQLSVCVCDRAIKKGQKKPAEIKCSLFADFWQRWYFSNSVQTGKAECGVIVLAVMRIMLHNLFTVAYFNCLPQSCFIYML